LLHVKSLRIRTRTIKENAHLGSFEQRSCAGEELLHTRAVKDSHFKGKIVQAQGKEQQFIEFLSGRG
jgi:hypothetical protein